MSLAQFGQKKYDAAVEALDDALKHCDEEEKDFVRMVKVRMHLHDSGRCHTIRHSDHRLI